MSKVGLIALLIGTCSLVGYWLVVSLNALYLSEAPLVVKVAIPVVILGVLISLVAVIRDRIMARKTEDFEEVEY